MNHHWSLLALSVTAVLAGCGGAGPAVRAGAGLRDSGGRFLEVAQPAGLRFRHVNGAAGEFYFPETFGAGGLFFDYDRDGWLDVFLVNGEPLTRDSAPGARRLTCALFQNNRDGTFRDATRRAGLAFPLYGMGSCAGDYDNDGYPDLYVTAALGSGRLLHNQGNGTFRDATREAGVGNDGHWGTSCAWLDYDLDGRLDLFVCNYVHYRQREEKVCRAGGRRVYCGPLVYPADSCRLYRNMGGGRFREVTHPAGIFKRTGKSLGVAVWDLDGDRYPEIVVANDLTPNYLFRNERDGTFAEVGMEAGVAYGGDGAARSGMGIDVADAANDGKSAILVSNFAREPNSYFTWQGGFLFSDRTYESGMGSPSLQSLGFGLFFFDYDNDGWKDAFITNGHIQPEIARTERPLTYAQPPLLFRNQRDGTFNEVSQRLGGPLALPIVGRGAAYGDYDNDGALDILLTSNDGPAELLRNLGDPDRHWLQIELEGRARNNATSGASNRDGMGALVLVKSGNTVQRDFVRSGSSYLSQSMLRLHFGLDRARTVDWVEIRWPSGLVDRLTGVPADQRLRITEGETGAGTAASRRSARSAPPTKSSQGRMTGLDSHRRRSEDLSIQPSRP